MHNYDALRHSPFALASSHQPPPHAAGAFSATTAASAPAFQLLSLTGHAATVFSYGLARGEVQVTKLTHTKGGGGSAAAAAES